MIFYINTTVNNFVEVGLKNKNRFIVKKKFACQRMQAEKLLASIDKLLKISKLKLSDLKGIEVADHGGGFTSLRVGVTAANALGYALGVPAAGNNLPAGGHGASGGEVRSKKSEVKNSKFSVVEPWYEREPVIGRGRTTEKRKSA